MAKDARGYGSKGKLTPALAESIYELLRKGHYVESAAAYVGVPKSTLSGWRQKGAEAIRLEDEKPLRPDYLNATAYNAALRAWTTKRNAFKPYRDFVENFETARLYGEAWLVEQILELAGDEKRRDNKWTAYMTILERSRRERWGRGTRVEHAGEGGKPIEVKFAFDPTPDPEMVEALREK